MKEKIQNATNLRFRTWYNYSPDDTRAEVTTEPSATIPEALPDLQLMLHRKSLGMGIPEFNGVYSEQNYPDYFKMDKTELHMKRLENRKLIIQLQEEFHDMSKAQEERLKREQQEAQTPSPSLSQQRPPE